MFKIIALAFSGMRKTAMAAIQKGLEG